VPVESGNNDAENNQKKRSVDGMTMGQMGSSAPPALDEPVAPICMGQRIIFIAAGVRGAAPERKNLQGIVIRLPK